MKVYLICGILFVAACTAEPDRFEDKVYLIVKDAGLDYSRDQVAKYSTMLPRLMNDINHRANLKLDRLINEFIGMIRYIPNDDLRGHQFFEASRLFLLYVFPKLSDSASMGWEKSALGLEATMLVLFRKYEWHAIIDANCQQFLAITEHQLEEQICEIYARYIQEDIKRDLYFATDALIRALYGNNSVFAVWNYQRLLEMMPTSTTVGPPEKLGIVGFV
uniref:Uncharacterized protein n=1 Tax=Bursaphelenchus xylophilus TaxID=6326 RepID=A0A1I7RQS6_BURXY